MRNNNALCLYIIGGAVQPGLCIRIAFMGFCRDDPIDIFRIMVASCINVYILKGFKIYFVTKSLFVYLLLFLPIANKRRLNKKTISSFTTQC